MRRRLSRSALVAILVIVTFFYPMLAPTAHRIDQAHFDLIKDDMTQADVEAIFGVPAGRYDWATADYSNAFRRLATQTRPRWEFAFGLGHQAIYAPGHSLELFKPGVWVSRHGVCTIHFDRQHRMVHRAFWPHTRIEPPWTHWWAKLRRG